MTEDVHAQLAIILAEHRGRCVTAANTWHASCLSSRCGWSDSNRGDLDHAHRAHRSHVADELMRLVDQVRVDAAADALDDAAAAIYNGASDPEQELYDHGASPWLTLRALYLRAGARNPLGGS